MTVRKVLTTAGRRRPVSRRREAKQVPATVVLSRWLNSGFWGRRLLTQLPMVPPLYSPRVWPHLLSRFGMSPPRVGDKRLTSTLPTLLGGPSCQLWFNQLPWCETLCGEAHAGKGPRGLQSSGLEDLSAAQPTGVSQEGALPGELAVPVACGRPSVANTLHRFLGPVLVQGQ